MATSSGGAEERAADGREKGQGELRICSGQYQRSPLSHLYIIPGYELPTSPTFFRLFPCEVSSSSSSSLSLSSWELSDTKVYEPYIRARLGTDGGEKGQGDRRLCSGQCLARNPS